MTPYSEHDAGTSSWARDTKTVHVLRFTVADDALSAISPGDEVRIVLSSRFGSTAERRLSYRDERWLIGDKNS